MNRKMLPVWMVLFIFAHFGLTLYAVVQSRQDPVFWERVAKVLGFPLLALLDTFPLESSVFANSVLWGLVLGATGVVLLRVR